MINVWSVLTDYNRLSTHVPNLVESKIVAKNSGGQPGDGQYRCRLYQRGAQKVVGFEFGADVTMDMVEEVPAAPVPSERRISFRCVDSFFFNAFDGDWKATEVTNPKDGQTNTVLSYTVDVRPRGPVPVAALEWQIREEVPTNLRAVKRAALEPDNELQGRIRGLLEPAREAVPVGAGRGANSGMQVKVDWYEDETMAAYLKK